jgi:hypothetical protein
MPEASTANAGSIHPGVTDPLTARIHSTMATATTRLHMMRGRSSAFACPLRSDMMWATRVMTVATFERGGLLLELHA